MKKVFALIEKESAKFAQLPFFEFLGNPSIDLIQRLSFAACFALFVMGYGDLNKFVWLEEPTFNQTQDIINKQNREKENYWIWFLKDLEDLNFNRFLSFTDSLKFNWSEQTLICRQIIYELYRRTFQVNPIYKLVAIESIESISNIFFSIDIHKQASELVNKIFELFIVLVDMLVNFAEEYKIKQLLTRSFTGSDYAQLACGKKATVGV